MQNLDDRGSAARPAFDDTASSPETVQAAV